MLGIAICHTRNAGEAHLDRLVYRYPYSVGKVGGEDRKIDGGVGPRVKYVYLYILFW